MRDGRRLEGRMFISREPRAVWAAVHVGDHSEQRTERPGCAGSICAKGPQWTPAMFAPRCVCCSTSLEQP